MEFFYFTHCVDDAVGSSRGMLNHEEVFEISKSSSGKDDEHEEIFGEKMVSTQEYSRCTKFIFN